HQVEANPDKRLQFPLQQPLHIGLNSALPREPPVSRNYFAAVARQTFLGNSSVGLMLTSVNPFNPRCTAADIDRQNAVFAQQPLWVRANSADPIQLQDCQAYGGNTGGIDFNLRSRTGEWVAMGTVVGTRRIGGPADDVLRDGTVMQPGDLGAGGYVVAGKRGGEGIRAYLNLRYSTPKMDVNAIGFQQSQNQQAFGGNLRYYRSRGIGSLHELQLNFYASSWWTTDGRWTARGIYSGGEFSMVLPGYQQIGFNVNLEVPRYDVREVKGYGGPFERVGDVAYAVLGSTDPNRPLVLSGVIFGARQFDQSLGKPQWAYGGDLTLFIRPAPWSETQLIGHYENNPQGQRYVDCLGTLEGSCREAGYDDPFRNKFLFARQDPQISSLTLRQPFVFPPRLTLQIYAQFFTAGSHFHDFSQAFASAGERIQLSQLQALPGLPAGEDNPDFHDAAFNA